jgi:MoxR-like ATPase
MSKAQQLIDLLTDKYGDEPRTLTSKEIREVANDNGITSLYKVMNAGNRVARGVFNFPPVSTSRGETVKVAKPKKTKVVKMPAPKQESAVSLSMETNAFSENLVPAKDPLFVPFGNFKVVRDIIKSKMFYPVFITGLSGNGKTYMVEQACAATKREVIRVNFTVETDEDDLIGGFRLVDGETKFFKGPVIKAMEKGAVLLCDEIDLANPAKVMCLQSILEGSGYFIKKTGEYITPASGFTVVATANTKGKGSDDGRFIGTNILNEAFLERYPITCEQEYPTVSIEKKILNKVAESVEVTDTEYVDKLTDWADIIRKTFADGGVDEIISTRRLVHIIKAYAIFNDRMTAIEMCTNRFDEETKLAFRDLYTKLDAGVIQIEDEIDSIIEESETTGEY